MLGIRRRARALPPVGPSTIQPAMDWLYMAMTSTTGSYYSPTLIERVGAAVRCLQLASQQVATMPLRHKSRSTRDAPPWVANPDPAYYPNGITDVVFAATWHMYQAGDAFAWATSRLADGYPATFTLLDPYQVTVEAAPEGGRRYRYGSDYLDPDDIVQITRDPRGYLRGTGALEAFAGNLMAASQADSYAADVLVGGGLPASLLKSARRLTAEQAAEVQQQWVTRRAENPGAPAILPPELEFLAQSFSPKDLMLLESRVFDGKAICSAFGTPPFLLGYPQADGLNYSNPAMLMDTWWRTELMPAAHRIEAALSTRWLPRGSWVEFDPSVILRPDLAALSAVVNANVESGLLTADEGRSMLFDLPPLSEGEAIELIDEPPGVDASDQSAPDVAPALEVVQ